MQMSTSWHDTKCIKVIRFESLLFPITTLNHFWGEICFWFTDSCCEISTFANDVTGSFYFSNKFPIFILLFLLV